MVAGPSSNEGNELRGLLQEVWLTKPGKEDLSWIKRESGRLEIPKVTCGEYSLFRPVLTLSALFGTTPPANREYICALIHSHTCQYCRLQPFSRGIEFVTVAAIVVKIKENPNLTFRWMASTIFGKRPSVNVDWTSLSIA